MEISASCLSRATFICSSSILHSPFSDQSHLQLYPRRNLFSPSELFFTLPSLSVPSKPSITPVRALSDSVCDAGVEPAPQKALILELADLKLQIKQKKKELKGRRKDGTRKLKIQMKEGKKMKKQKEVSEGKKKMKCSAGSESSDDACESVSVTTPRQGQFEIGDASFNGEEGLLSENCSDRSAGLPSRVCASCEDDVCGGPSSNFSASGHGAVERFAAKDSRVSDGSAEILFARASVVSFNDHAGSASRVIPGKSHGSTACRGLLASRLGSVSDVLPSVHSSNRIEVCAGGKCKKAGSEQLLYALRGQIPGTSNVKAVPCKCMGKCSTAINVRVHKEDTNLQHHSHVASVDDATLILEHHFGLGRPLSGLPSVSLKEVRSPSPHVVA